MSYKGGLYCLPVSNCGSGFLCFCFVFVFISSLFFSSLFLFVFFFALVLSVYGALLSRNQLLVLNVSNLCCLFDYCSAVTFDVFVTEADKVWILKFGKLGPDDNNLSPVAGKPQNSRSVDRLGMMTGGAGLFHWAELLAPKVLLPKPKPSKKLRNQQNSHQLQLQGQHQRHPHDAAEPDETVEEAEVEAEEGVSRHNSRVIVTDLATSSPQNNNSPVPPSEVETQVPTYSYEFRWKGDVFYTPTAPSPVEAASPLPMPPAAVPAALGAPGAPAAVPLTLSLTPPAVGEHVSVPAPALAPAVAAAASAASAAAAVVVGASKASLPPTYPYQRGSPPSAGTGTGCDSSSSSSSSTSTSTTTGNGGGGGARALEAHFDLCTDSAGVDSDAFVPLLLRNRYELGEVLGKGGFASVREGLDLKTGTKVAIKILPRSTVKNSHEVAIRREVKILAMLDHPNIVRTFDFIEEPEHYYLVLERIHGKALFDRIKLRTVHTEGQVRVLATVLLSAIQHCHRHNVVHRYLFDSFFSSSS
jgi:hypothetical protein